MCASISTPHFHQSPSTLPPPQWSSAKRRVTARLVVVCCAALQLLGVASTVVEAQGLPIKSALAASGVSGCAAFAPPMQATNTTPNADAESRRLIDDAQDAALQGDHGAARDAFAKAAVLVPGNARVAYYLGRELEALAEATTAVREYCRYLALSPAAPDADEVRGRIVRLTPASDVARVGEAQANFRSGVALLQRKQYLAADSAFGSVARQVPAAPEPYFNRALSRAARGDRTAAMQDFEKYLELSPLASDRPVVRGSMARLQDRVYGPGQAFGSGVLIPGLGQMNTGRPLLGVFTLGAVGGVIAVALASKRETVAQSFTDPFGNAYSDSLQRTTRPMATAGLAVAAALWLGAALESSSYARRSHRRAESIIARVIDDPVSLQLAVEPMPHQRVGIGVSLRLRGISR